MRTTIQLDDQLHEKARQYAMSKGTTFTALIEEALREKLLSSANSTPSELVKLKTVDGHGTLPGIDLDNNAALLDLMESK